MPLIVLIVFYTLTRLRAGADTQRSASVTPAAADGRP
jgi:hypothetical protein